jgi:hypothetical protein
MLKLSNKRWDEVVDIAFDFSSLLSATGYIQNPNWEVTVYKGADASPTDLLEGTTAIAGTIAYARLNGGIAGVTYKIACGVDADCGEFFVGEATMLVTS